MSHIRNISRLEPVIDARLMLLMCSLMAAICWSCSTSALRSDDLSRRLGFNKTIVDGEQFRHVVYHNHAIIRDQVLHVYIEGDGIPFAHLDSIAEDPTSRDPLMMRLMAEDADGSIDLGRPCYFGLSRDSGCAPIYWTTRRYSPEVLDSMEAALRSEAARVGATRLDLFGHSGGGVLAVLLGQRMSIASRVVTIAPNLDIDQWCRLHHYSPLVGSINPATADPSRKDLSVVHLVGANDDNTPPWLVEAAAAARGGENVRVIPRFTHNCCWSSLWPAILAEHPGEQIRPPGPVGHDQAQMPSGK